MSAKVRPSLKHALALSQQLLAATEQSDFELLVRLDAERLRLLQSVRLERRHLSDADRQVLQQVIELNDRAVGLMEYQRWIKGREMDLVVVGRCAVAAYSTTGL